MKITLCGSIVFYEEMELAKKSLQSNGHEVCIPLLSNEIPEVGGDRKIDFGKYFEDHGGIDSFPPSDALWDIKEKAIREHFEKIEWADAILVVNPAKRGIEGYVGANTLMEMGVAFFLRKPIFILNLVSSELSSKAEVLGMKPIFLQNDLNLIPT